MPELAGIEISLTDINPHSLEQVEKIISRIVKVSNLPTRITATTDLREALKDARHIMNVMRIGGLKVFADDIRILLKYGVDQCVGNTICAGELMYSAARHRDDAEVLPGNQRGIRNRRLSALDCRDSQLV